MPPVVIGNVMGGEVRRFDAMVSILVRWLMVSMLLCAIAWLAAPRSAAAQTCSASATSMPFGNINPAMGADAIATVAISCTGGTPRRDVQVCPYLAAGTGGAGASGPRYLTASANSLAFDVYTTSAYTTRYANGVVLGANPAFTVTLDGSGGGIANLILYGRVAGGQGSAPPNTYSSVFSSPTQIGYGIKNGAFVNCSMAAPSTATFSFTASARVIASCTVSSAPVAFPALHR